MKSIFNFLFIFGGIIVFNYVDATVDNRCTLPILTTNPMEQLTCTAYIPIYFYDIAENKCVSFVYGGCGGGANNFYSQEDCQQSCVKETKMRKSPKDIYVERCIKWWWLLKCW